MKRRIFITLVVALMTLSLFANGAKEVSERTKIDVLTWGGADRLSYLKTIYEKTTDLSSDKMADIVFTSGGTGATDAYQLFRLQLALHLIVLQISYSLEERQLLQNLLSTEIYKI